MMNILMATDLSSEAELAQRRARLLAQFVHGKLHIVHVAEDGDVPAPPEPRHENPPGFSPECGTVKSIPGDPCAVIPDLARSADLLVLGEPRRRSAGKLFTGTTGERIIRRSPVPVLVVRTEAHSHYRRVLLAVDLSPQSIEIMRTSKALGLAPAGCRVIYAYEAPQVNLMVEASTYSIDKVREHIAHQQRDFDKKLSDQMRKAGLIGLADAVPTESSPASAILAFAQRIQADLIVLGSRRRSNLAAFVLGSVAAQVLSHSTTDVLIVPPVKAGKIER
ncbi:universal stress protein [Pollutimonas bauzanensis]|uniref:Nucleotide-binding universal stress protein, UspA family n=1 Tax=Pollutimonas bauzanensis TaxID=658167 RepID=A0A1M5UKS8_9BURK|nr:universal stress protein [Pollutimonas bauzanensis]SHH63662.1 Nucleotide-binding universal stress protein, UspA family [Pollutimonas bauzanensis]